MLEVFLSHEILIKLFYLGGLLILFHKIEWMGSNTVYKSEFNQRKILIYNIYRSYTHHSCETNQKTIFKKKVILFSHYNHDKLPKKSCYNKTQTFCEIARRHLSKLICVFYGVTKRIV